MILFDYFVDIIITYRVKSDDEKYEATGETEEEAVEKLAKLIEEGK